MTFPEVQFVASPDAGAAVRFDFNQAGTWSTDQIWPAHDGVSLGAPTLEGDPDGIGADYGFRQLTFDLIIVGTHAAAAAAVSALAKELVRQTNWLRVRMTATSVPVWFKTYRSAPSAIDFEHVYAADDVTRNTFGVSIELDADPFAYGAVETALSSVAVNNNPVAVTNPMSVVLPTIKGDAPAPLVIKAVAPTSMDGYEIMWSSASLDRTFPAAPLLWQGELAASGTATADATFTGGSYRKFTTFPQQVIGSFTLTNYPGGRYRVFARVASSDTTSTFTIRMDDGNYPLDTLTGPTVTWTSKHTTWVDLGQHALPSRFPTELRGATPYSAAAFMLAVNRTAGAGDFRLDALIAFPVDVTDGVQASAIQTWFGGFIGPSNTATATWDGDLETFYMVGTSGPSAGQVVSVQVAQSRGAFPVAVPGVTNILYLIQQVAMIDGASSTDQNDVIARAMTVTVTYRPRWLYLGAS